MPAHCGMPCGFIELVMDKNSIAYVLDYYFTAHFKNIFLFAPLCVIQVLLNTTLVLYRVAQKERMFLKWVVKY
jgi:hypothetical protein